MNRPLAIQNLSPRISSASERVRFECGAAEVRHYSVPEPVRQVADGWLMDRVKKAVAERTGNTAPFKFFDGGEVRLDTVDVCRSESPPEVIVNLTTSFTGYYRSRVTNEYCNRFLATGRTIFEEYGGRLRDLSDSVLSNPIAVSYLVVTSDGLVAVAKRANLANNAEKTPDVLLPLVVTVSGTCEPSKCCDEKGRFNLVEAVVAEYEEEVFRGHRLDPEQIHHLGIARTTGFLYPFVFGFITCGKTHEEVDGADRTTDDGIREIEGYEFIPNSVDGIIAKLEQIDNWRNPDNTRRRIEDSLLFCLSRYAHYLNLQTNQYSPDELDHRLNPQVKAGST